MTTKTYYQVEAKFHGGGDWQRNEVHRETIEEAETFREFFAHMAETHIIKRTESEEEEVIA